MPPPKKKHGAEMHRVFFLPVKALPPAPNGPGTGGGRCHATYLCGERFNSRPPRGERPDGAYTGGTDARISIHALREEGDVGAPVWIRAKPDFNPRPPRGGRPAVYAQKQVQMRVFQSTPSARRATSASTVFLPLHPYFNPRPPRGGRHVRAFARARVCAFQSTPSARRATMAV